MAFVDINTKVRLTLTKYGKQKLIDGNFNIKYFSFSDESTRYDLDVKPDKIKEILGNGDTTIYNSNNSTIIYKK